MPSDERLKDKGRSAMQNYPVHREIKANGPEKRTLESLL